MEVLYALESIRTPLLNELFSLITNFGSEVAFMVVAIIVFWSIDKKCGYYILTVGFIGTLINQFCKIYFQIPRPWVKDPNFTIVESARADATGFSFPSGHTQNLFATYGASALYFKKKWYSIIAVVIIVLTAFSRMYLGVHTPYDVSFSILVGLFLMFALYPIFDKSKDNMNKLMIALSILLILSILFVIYMEVTDFNIPADDINLIEAFKTSYMMLFCGVALIITYIVDTKWVHFETKAVWWANVLKVVIGLAIVVAIKSVLKTPLLTLTNGHPIAHGIRYFIMMVFAGAVWPLTFKFWSKLGKEKNSVD